MLTYDFIVVGAGFSGATIAERLANGMRAKVLLVDQRPHVGGNAYDCYSPEGILYQLYGPHIFHTQYREVWEYLNQFTAFNSYEHRVLASVRGRVVYLPINLETMEKIKGQPFTAESLQKYFDQVKLPVASVKNSRDVVVSQVGEELYELFFKYYSRKQWGMFPDELSPEVLKRLPIRFNRDTRYFADPYQGIPVPGYTRMFDKMVFTKNIHVLLNCDYQEILAGARYGTLIYTGPIDYFFSYRHGRLPYRSLRFELKIVDREKFQDAAVVNYPNDHDYTRITEYKHFYLQQHAKTLLCYEYPCAEGDPYYPIPNPAHQELYQKYFRDAQKRKRTHFLGRLAEYKYINMDQAVFNALRLFEKIQGGQP